MSNPRIPKLAEQIQEIVAQMLQRRVKDPRLGFVTITDVRLTGDARDATIFYTVLEDEEVTGGGHPAGPAPASTGGHPAGPAPGRAEQLAETAAALESAKGLLRSTVGKKLGLRFAPTLTFVLDATPQAAKDMEELIERVRSRDADLAAHRGDRYAGGAEPYRKTEESAGEAEWQPGLSVAEPADPDGDFAGHPAGPASASTGGHPAGPAR